MEPVNVYNQYFEAKCTYNGVERRGASVLLIVTSEKGEVRYDAAVSFFPHRDAEDFGISYDAYFEKELYRGKGRRSRKREAALMDTLRESIDELAASAGGTVDWDKPLNEARRG